MTTRRRPSLAGALRLTYAALAVADTTLAGVGVMATTPIAPAS